MYDDNFHKNIYFYEKFKTYSQYISKSEFFKFQTEVLKSLDYNLFVSFENLTIFYQNEIEK